MYISIIFSNTTLSGDTLHLQAKKRVFWHSKLHLHLYPETTPQSKRKSACIIENTKVWRMVKLPKVLSGKLVWKSESVIDI